MAAMTGPISASAAASSSDASGSGNGAIMMESAGRAMGSFCQISSVMKGMNGWSSRRIRSRQKTSTARVLSLALASSP